MEFPSPSFPQHTILPHYKALSGQHNLTDGAVPIQAFGYGAGILPPLLSFPVRALHILYNLAARLPSLSAFCFSVSGLSQYPACIHPENPVSAVCSHINSGTVVLRIRCILPRTICAARVTPPRPWDISAHIPTVLPAAPSGAYLHSSVYSSYTSLRMKACSIR